MPPRLCSSARSPSLIPSRSVQSQIVIHPSRASRGFSQTPCRQATARRRHMYEWYNNGPGAGLRQSLPGSSNYLGAYDRYGNLVRAPPGWQERRQKAQAEPQQGAQTEAPQGQETDDLEMAARRNEQETEKHGEPKLPPETAEDLRPFPMNKYFRSQPVLSEELREAIYQRVSRDGASVSLASVEFGVSNERVGAVVRLKQMEKEWSAQGRKLATPYSRAVLNMVPTTPYIDPSLPENKGKRPITHEAINDLVVHPATRQQLFVPVSESRHFTREDAGKAFDNNLLPADDRIPHPELVLAERELAQGLHVSERRQLAEERMAKEQARKRKEEEKMHEELKKAKTVPGRRWDFVFQDISVETVGKDGRNSKGVGWRYGFPHDDRKKGQVKIPTKVEA